MKDFCDGRHRLLQLPLRMLSLRTLIIVAALSVVAVVIIIGPRV